MFDFGNFFFLPFFVRQRPEREKAPPCLITFSSTRQDIFSVFPTFSAAGDDERANSNQLIFHSARVLAFVRSALWVVWDCSCTIEGWWRFHPSPPPLPPLHFSFSYFVSKQLGLFYLFFSLQKLSLQQPTGIRAALQTADGSLASRVRGSDEIALGMCAWGGEGTRAEEGGCIGLGWSH